MLLLTIKVLGWLIAHAPEFLLRGVSTLLGDFTFVALRSRRRLILSNLHHAFPERSAAWRRRIGRASCRRMVETALLALATPYLNANRMKRIVLPTPELLACYASHAQTPVPVVVASPHIAYWEVQTAMPLVVPGTFPEFGIIFRPLDNPAADAFVKRSREQYGMRLLSRKEGFAEALKILRRRGFVGVLFDQNAGLQGALTLLLDRVCSTSELPGLMAEKFGGTVYGIYPRRLGFWRVEIGLERITAGGSGPDVTLALNRWLEQLLRKDDELCAGWLWAHARWRNQDIPERRLRLEAKRNLLASDLAARGLTVPPRRTRIWIRMPNWLGDVVMVLPLLRTLRASRPDAELTLVARKQFLPLLSAWGVADRLHPLPPRGAGYWRRFRALRSEYIDVWLLFTNSFRGDLEAWLSGTRQRFGILRAGKRRPLLSHAYVVPAGFDESRHHQLELWENFLRHFGLAGEIDRTPVGSAPPDQRAAAASDQSAASDTGRATTDRAPAPGERPPPPAAIDSASARVDSSPIGLIPGSENTPEKRWPVAHWRTLIEALADERFVVFGTANDVPIANAVADGFGARVENRAGRTDLPAFAAGLAACPLLVTNDTGGMHLANAAGVPVVALFGPTNPVRTGPVFATPAQLLQPPGCPPTGGGNLADLKPEFVVAEVRRLRAARFART